jgi:hypothetical protein
MSIGPSLAIFHIQTMILHSRLISVNSNKKEKKTGTTQLPREKKNCFPVSKFFSEEKAALHLLSSIGKSTTSI